MMLKYISIIYWFGAWAGDRNPIGLKEIIYKNLEEREEYVLEAREKRTLVM